MITHPLHSGAAQAAQSSRAAQAARRSQSSAKQIYATPDGLRRTAMKMLTALSLCMTIVLSLPLPNAFAQSNRVANIQLTLKSKADCPSNLVLLSDVATLSGSDAIVQEIEDVQVALAPRSGQEQSLTRQTISKALTARGIASDAIRWKGATECAVRRTDGPRPPKSDRNKDANKNAVKPANFNAGTANEQNQQAPSTITPLGTVDGVAQPIDRSQFTSPFTTPVVVTQAERIAVEAISSYLQTKTNSDGRWIVKAQVPTEHAKLLTQKRQILGVAGGQPPWEGDQEFIFLIKGPTGTEQSLSIKANVKLPEMVVAANRTLAKGYILREEDLAWVQMPKGLPFGPEDCFPSIESLVGKQLRRGMNTQQVIRLSEVGPPTLIHVGDIISLEVISGSIVVTTNGRAVEAGGLDDLIQVDVEPHKSRVMARITGDRKAEVLANGMSRISSAKPGNNRQNPTR